MEGGRGVTRGIIDQLLSWDIQGDQMEGKSLVLLEVSSMNLILRVAMEIKWKVKVVLLVVSLMNFMLGISNELKFQVKATLLEGSLMKLILGMFMEIKWKVKVVLLQVTLMNFILHRSNEIKKEGESGVARSVIDELHSWDIQGDQMQ